MSKSMYGEKPSPTSGAANWVTDLAPFGSRKLKVIWDISNKCNLRCRMCHFSFDEVFRREAHYTSPADFERIAAAALPVAHTLILSAANEPLMSPHFIDILRIAARHSVPRLLFLTNGQLLTERVADAILETGVTEVQISIDGATKETYEYIRRGGRFERLIQNLEYLTAQKRLLGRSSPRLQFNLVLMRRNLEELPLFVDLAERLGVEWIAARHLLMMRGLDMEQESLALERARANAHFQSFFERVERSSTVSVIEFPDFFDGQPFIPKCHSGSKGDRIRMPADKPVEPTNSKPPHPAPSVPIGVTGKIARELRRIPRNVRRALFPVKSAPRPARPPKLCALPFGSVDLPIAKEITANNAIQLSGWALDRVGIDRVTIERHFFDERGPVEIGQARILNGSRPDVGQVFRQYPYLFRAGWTFQLTREMLSPNPSSQTPIHIFAHSVDGRSAEIGHRMVSFSAVSTAKPYLFCSRPFDSLFIDSRGDIRPYPDCRPERPYGSMAGESASLREIWFGENFRTLRQQIIDRDPPPMCLTCAHFINRNVDDPDYFGSR